ALLPASKRTSPATLLRNSASRPRTSTFPDRSKSAFSSSGVIRGALTDILFSSSGKAFGIRRFEFHSNPQARAVWLQHPVHRLRHSVEKHSLNASVVVKVFKVPHRDRRAANMHVQRRSGMGRQGQVVGLAQGCRLKESSESSAARSVGLEHVYRP